jgi:hypothetical protein
MSLTVEAGPKLDIDQIYGHDFRIPLISRSQCNCDNYELTNLYLISGFEGLIPRLRKQNIAEVCQCMNDTFYNGKLNGQILYDLKSGIISQISLDIPGTQSSRVSLDQGFIRDRSGVYGSENIRDLSTAIVYQKFIANYLTFMSDCKTLYPYIDGNRDGFSSQHLGFPENISLEGKNITNEVFRDRFLGRAHYISGQFSTEINYLKYSDNGVLKIIQTDGSKDCHYILDRRNYYGHNIDFPSEAATLHGITAEFINEIITRTEDKNRK